MEKLSYLLIRAYILDKSNKKKEAGEEVDSVLKEISEKFISDPMVID